jgi:hypothetical protein
MYYSVAIVLDPLHTKELQGPKQPVLVMGLLVPQLVGYQLRDPLISVTVGTPMLGLLDVLSAVTSLLQGYLCSAH